MSDEPENLSTGKATKTRTRNAGKRTQKRKHETLVPAPVDPDVAPAATPPLEEEERQNQELEGAKIKCLMLETMLQGITNERDYYKSQFAQLQKSKKSEKEPAIAIDSTSESQSSYSVSTSSDSESSESPSSSSSSSSSSDDRRRKKKKKKKSSSKKSRKTNKSQKGKKKKRGKKELGTKRLVTRARTPDEVLLRYKRVLKVYQKKKSMSASFKKVGVDRNTIISNAPIAELAIGAPEEFAELQEHHSRQEKLADFAQKCQRAITASSQIEEAIGALKKVGKLLPVGKGKF